MRILGDTQGFTHMSAIAIAIRKSEVVAAIRDVRDILQGLSVGEEVDARLHVWQADDSFGIATYWKLDWGLADYDTEVGDYVGAVTVSATDRVKSLGELADSLIGQVKDQAA